MCKKQTSVSHSSTEAEVISLDAGLRMAGILALDLWDLVIEVFHSSPNQTHKTKDVREPQGNLSQPLNTNLDLIHIDHVPSSGTHSGSNAMLYVFEEQELEERCVAKSRSTAMNLSSHVPTSSSSAKSPIVSQRPGILIATEKTEGRMRGNSESDAASSSQARLQDAFLGGLMDNATGKLVATKEDSGDVDLSESETGSEENVTRKPVAHKRASGKPHASSKSECQGSPKAERTEWSHKLHVSPATVHHTEAVFVIVRRIYRREHDDPTNDLDVNVAIWSILLNTTLRAAVHLGQDHDANLHYVKSHHWNSVGQLFNETGKLISEQKEITGVSTIAFKDATWMSTSLLCEKAYRITNAKVVFSDSVLCVGKMGDDPIATWRSRTKMVIRKTITSRM